MQLEPGQAEQVERQKSSKEQLRELDDLEGESIFSDQKQSYNQDIWIKHILLNLIEWDVVNARFLYYRHKERYNNNGMMGGGQRPALLEFMKSAFINDFEGMQRDFEDLEKFKEVYPQFKTLITQLGVQLREKSVAYVAKNFKSITPERYYNMTRQKLEQQDVQQAKEVRQEQQELDIKKLTLLAQMVK